VPTELVDDNKVRAALHGIEGELIDFPHRKSVPAGEMVRHLVQVVRDDAVELGCEAELDGVERLVAEGTGARRQVEMLRAGSDMRDVVREVVSKTRPRQ
jgi:carboxylate-amine ligase